MSKRISMERARKLRARESELQQMQKEGKPLPKSTRRQKKYLMQIRKQEGFFSYLKERYSRHGSEIPKHLEKKQ